MIDDLFSQSVSFVLCSHLYFIDRATFPHWPGGKTFSWLKRVNINFNLYFIVSFCFICYDAASLSAVDIQLMLNNKQVGSICSLSSLCPHSESLPGRTGEALQTFHLVNL